MRYFPQLETRTTAQYPLRRDRHERIVRHEGLDGSTRQIHDANAARVEWALNYEGLTDGERAAIEALFSECEGRLQNFVFLDPASNLLRWSEKYNQSAWTRGPMLSVTHGVADRWGTSRATSITNGGAAAQSVAQMISAPGSLQYCLSAYVRGGGRRFRLRIDSGGVAVEQEFTATGEWQRYFVAAQPGSAAETVTFSLVLDAGEQVDVCGIQAEAQPAPGGYRPTTTRSGVYANARFAEDEMAWTQQAPNNNAAEIRIESRPI